MPNIFDKIVLKGGEKANIKALNKLLEIHKSNKIINAIEFEKYLNNLYEENITKVFEDQKKFNEFLKKHN